MNGVALAAVLIIIIPSLPSVSSAGPNVNAKIQLHLISITCKNCCSLMSARPVCSGMNTHGDLYPPNLYYAAVLVTDGNAEAGIGGLQFGISYGSGSVDGVGVDIFGWWLCATLDYQQPSPAWPENNSGNLVTWDTTTRCQRYEPGGGGTGVTALAGFLYVGAYSAADLHVIPRPLDGVAKVASCAGEEDIVDGAGVVRTPSHLGSCGFGTEPGNSHAGYNPCGLNTSVEATTWSAVKLLYGGN